MSQTIDQLPAVAEARQVQPGIHPDAPAEIYHAWPFASNSRLSILHESCPAKLRHRIDNPPEPTDSLVIGSALHCSVLEVDTFLSRYACAPACDRRTKEGKAMWANFLDLNAGKSVLTVSQWQLVCEMSHAIEQNPRARDALAAATEREVSMVWDDADTGLRCKARVDALGRDAGLIVDLKTTDNAGRDFERSIDTWGYARQAAFYLRGAAARDVPIEDFLIIAVEKTPPYLVGLHRINEAAIKAAAKELRPLIETYWQCETTNHWPGYEPRDADLPTWAHKRIAAASAAKEQS